MDNLKKEIGHKMFLYKTVLLPTHIVVVCGNYCWNEKESRKCDHLGTKWGHPECGFKLGTLRYDREGNIPKPKKCKELKEI